MSVTHDDWSLTQRILKSEIINYRLLFFPITDDTLDQQTGLHLLIYFERAYIYLASLLSAVRYRYVS